MPLLRPHSNVISARSTAEQVLRIGIPNIEASNDYFEFGMQIVCQISVNTRILKRGQFGLGPISRSRF